MEMEAGGYGTVCGLNSQAANVACRQIGFEFGVVSPAGCAEYGGASFCGASGSPVAAKAMQCAGTEMSLKECKHDAPDDACLSHASDSVVFCGTTSTTSAFFDGELRLIGASSATRSRTVGDVFGSHTSLGASLPGRVHQWLRCGCLQDHGFWWFCRVFCAQRRQRVRKGAASCFGFSVRGVREQRHAMPNKRR